MNTDAVFDLASSPVFNEYFKNRSLPWNRIYLVIKNQLANVICETNPLKIQSSAE